MNTITVGTENNGYYNILKESCKKNNIKLNNIGYKKKWTGFTMRYELLYDYLNKIDDDTIILFIDAYDVIILKDKSEIINKFKKFKKNIVFGLKDIINTIHFWKSNGFFYKFNIL